MSIEVKRFLDLGLKDLDPSSVDVDQGLKRIQVTITKAGEAGGNSLAKIPISSICTSACFSTISSLTVSAVAEKKISSTELRSLVALHQKAVSVLGEEGVVSATATHVKHAPSSFMKEIATEK
jgi:hypothetical protein